MANYCCTIRSNYFHVKNEDAFLELMSRVYGRDGGVELWKQKKDDGETLFGFGIYGGIPGVSESKEDLDEDCDESSYDEFIDRLQECVAIDDAIIILESGNENMRYIVGSATIITSTECKYMNITSLATEKAAELLKNPLWQTQCEY